MDENKHCEVDMTTLNTVAPFYNFERGVPDEDDLDNWYECGNAELNDSADSGDDHLNKYKQQAKQLLQTRRTAAQLRALLQQPLFLSEAVACKEQAYIVDDGEWMQSSLPKDIEAHLSRQVLIRPKTDRKLLIVDVLKATSVLTIDLYRTPSFYMLRPPTSDGTVRLEVHMDNFST